MISATAVGETWPGRRAARQEPAPATPSPNRTRPPTTTWRPIRETSRPLIGADTALPIAYDEAVRPECRAEKPSPSCRNSASTSGVPV